MTMMHPGLPWAWAIPVFIVLGLLSIRALVSNKNYSAAKTLRLAKIPLLGQILDWFTHTPWPLVAIKMIAVAVFLLVIVSGLFGTPIPARNFATTFTWTLWWTLIIISIFFLGSAWCAICPWDSLANWLVKRRFWRRNDAGSLQLRVPRWLRNVWPALWLFVGLTWFELGVGVTLSPYGTAMMALFILVLTIVSMGVFERKAFCRYFCPVGRTVGAYAQLAPIELRPIEQTTCDQCKTLDCYYGNEQVEPCPTHLVMGRLTQNTYCTSCGACVLSCPHDNINWRLRTMASEAMNSARPHWDEAWFMLALMSLTSFHGVTMMSFWETGVSRVAQFIGDSGQLLVTFSLGLALFMFVPILVYAAMVWLSARMSKIDMPYRRLFAGLSFVSIPLAFSYHIAHNLNHLINEASGIGAIMLNPLGIDTLPLSMAEMHEKHMNGLLPADVLYGLQAFIMGLGVWFAIQILQRRWQSFFLHSSENKLHRHRIGLLPVLIFIVAMAGFNMWLLMEPMVMRV